MKRSINHTYQIISIFSVSLLIIVLLTGCGKTSTFNGSRTSDETGFWMEYSVLNQEETAELDLSEGDQLQVVFSHTAGSVDVTVGQEGEDPIYRGAGQTNAEFVLTVSKAGSYRISVTGHQAQGKVSFTRISSKEE